MGFKNGYEYINKTESSEDYALAKALAKSSRSLPK